MNSTIIIGGDAAGLSAASKLKREDPDHEVIVLERGEWVSYGACGLPYYVKGDIDSLEDLVVMEAEEFRNERDIDLRTDTEATAIDADDRTVTAESNGETFELPYDNLLIATGAGALTPPIEGIDLTGVFTLQSMTAGRQIKQVLEDGLEHDGERIEPEAVGIVGGGYIGVEMAEAFHERGLDVHLFEMLPHVLNPFGEPTARVVEDHLREKGVTVHLETPVEAFQGRNGRVVGVATPENTVTVDFALMGAGVHPRTELAEEAGVELGQSGAIATDRYGETNLDDVYAAGDCAEGTHVVTGEPDHVPLALTANRHGRAIGASLAGNRTRTGPIAGTAVLKAFDLEVARTGIVDPERAAEAGFDPVQKTLELPSRAHYYPGGSELTVTLVADKNSGRLLGASMVGEEGVAQRINSVAAALHTEVTVGELEQFDFAYAPAYSPTWDPVLTSAKVLNGTIDSN
ncbi:FAD-dependent oxidoreductase [Natronomonas gomsonensis]|uniref:FAD-dependent oxidoreductase n=1 Tax=Natronomonas gomsonensis TaxID=1046043 RepID=UPI0015BDDB44|nr:FAD-dependent oxidoreductase [Natronomonas gomsonensis]